MAESSIDAQIWAPSTTSTNSHGSELAAPRLNPLAFPFAQPTSPQPYNSSYTNYSNSAMFQYPDSPPPQLGNQAQQMHFGYPGSHQRLDTHHSASGGYPYPIIPSRLPMELHSRPVGPHPDMYGLSRMDGTYPPPEHPMARSFTTSPPQYSQDGPFSPLNPPPLYSQQQSFSTTAAQSPAQYVSRRDTLPAPMRASPDRPRQYYQHMRRMSQQDPQQHSNRSQEHAERRGPAFFNAQSRRSDRSVSPLSSHRRSYDRFAYDMSHSRTSSEFEEAAARIPPSFRRRISREPRLRIYSHNQHYDPNLATMSQLQDLKDKLPRCLPSELSEETSKSCDICAKDYSSAHVKPSENDEVAIGLPCGHYFGEFCLFQWFDTCRTHKNKVTCPMCRKQLIEPSRYHPVLVSAMSRGGPAFQDLFSDEMRADLSQI